MKTIVICSSVAFYKQALEVRDELKKLGFAVEVPSTAEKMEVNGDFRVDSYKTWYENPNEYHVKRALMEEHIKRVVEGDAVLVLNYTKNGMDGYIGGNVLMEMAIGFYHRKPLYILNPIEEELPVKEEVYGMEPTFLKGDLSLIKL